MTCWVVSVWTIGVLLAQPGRYVVQKATWPSAGSLVTQLMVAAKGVMLVTVTFEMMGGVVSEPGAGVGEGTGALLSVGVGLNVGVGANVLAVLNVL